MISYFQVKGEISNILYKEQIKYIKSQGAWPDKFETAPPTDDLKSLDLEERGSEDSEEDDDDLFKNTNRFVFSDCRRDVNLHPFLPSFDNFQIYLFFQLLLIRG